MEEDKKQEEQWRSLSLSNDFMFSKVMRNMPLCRELLETILGVKIADIKYPEEQKEINIAKDARSIRLDVYIEDHTSTVYNIEMQTVATRGLPKRARYYGGMIDLNLIEKGELFEKLKPSYVIFICTFDFFGAGRHLYTFENICKEDPEIKLGDETTKLFLNAKGTLDDVSEELKKFLDYLVTGTADSDFTRKLDAEVERVKENKEWRREYMTLLLRDRENLEKGRAEGRKEGRKEGRAEGRKEGRKECRAEMILSILKKCSVEETAALLNIPIEEVMKIQQEAAILL